MRLNTDEQAWRVKGSVKDWEKMNFITTTLRQEEPDPKVISGCFTDWVKALKRYHCPDLCVVRALQKHPGGHGWHIHALFDRYIPAAILLKHADDCGLGRTTFDMVTGKDRDRSIDYLVRYITRDMKDRWKNPETKGVRLLTASGNKKSAGSWWWRLADITTVDSGNEARKVLQCLLEIHGYRFQSKNGRRRPMKLGDLIIYTSPELLEQWTAIINGPEHQAKLAKLFS